MINREFAPIFNNKDQVEGESLPSGNGHNSEAIQEISGLDNELTVQAQKPETLNHSRESAYEYNPHRHPLASPREAYRALHLKKPELQAQIRRRKLLVFAPWPQHQRLYVLRQDKAA